MKNGISEIKEYLKKEGEKQGLQIAFNGQFLPKGSYMAMVPWFDNFLDVDPKFLELFTQHELYSNPEFLTAIDFGILHEKWHYGRKEPYYPSSGWVQTKARLLESKNPDENVIEYIANLPAVTEITSRGKDPLKVIAHSFILSKLYWDSKGLDISYEKTKSILENQFPFLRKSALEKVLQIYNKLLNNL